jgi:hypothetical protein
VQPDLSGVATFFFGLFMILIIVGASVLFTYWISKDEWGMGFAVDCTRRVSIRMGTVCCPCKRWQRERRNYRHAR